MKKIKIDCKESDFDKSKFYFIKRRKFFSEIILKGEKFKVIGNDCNFSDFLLEKIKEELGVNEFFSINYSEEKKYFGKTKIINGNLIAYKFNN